MALAALRGDKTLTELAKQFGVHPIQVSKWKKELTDMAESVFEDKRESHKQNHMSHEDLERKIAQLTIELDFLKKIERGQRKQENHE